MSTLLATIDIEKLKVRWTEPYVSEALNKTFPAIGTGILQGFWPVPGGGLVLDLATGIQGLSMCMVHDTADGLSVLYREEAEVALDLAPFAEERVYIGIAVDYDISNATSGEIRAYTQAEFDGGLGDVAVVCAVDVPAVAIVVGDIDIGPREFVWAKNLIDGEVQRDDRWVNAVDQADGLLGTMLRPVVVGGPTVDVYTSVQAGSASAKVATFEHQGGGAVSDQRAIALVNVAAGEPIFLKLRRNLDGVTATTAGLRITWLTSSGTVVSNQWWEPTGASLAAVTEGWTEYRGSLVAPATTTNALISLGMQGFSAGTAHFEELFVSANGNDRRGRGVSNLAALGLSVVYQSPSSAVLNEAHMGWTAGAKFEVTSPTFLIRAQASNLLDVGMVSGAIGYYQTEGTHQLLGGNVLVGEDLVVSGDISGDNQVLTGDLEVQGNAVVAQVTTGILYPGTIKELDPSASDLLTSGNAYLNRYIRFPPTAAEVYTTATVTKAVGLLRLTGSGDDATFVFPILVPLGVTIIAAEAYANLGATDASIRVGIFKLRLGDGNYSVLSPSSVIDTGTAGDRVATVILDTPEVVTDLSVYWVEARLINGATGQSNFHGVRLGVQMTSLEHAF